MKVIRWFRSRLLSCPSLGAKLSGGIFPFSCLPTFRVRCPARKIAQLHCRFILPETAIAVYAPLFRMSTSSQLSRYLCSFNGQPQRHHFRPREYEYRGCGKHRPICNELALKGSEGLDGMKVHDCVLQKFFRLRDRLCRLRALRSHGTRLRCYPP